MDRTQDFKRDKIDIFLNTILVQEDIRSACMLQPNGLGEVNQNDPLTKKLLAELKAAFPTLKYSDTYETFQGIIISKKDFNGRTDISLEEMGEILGYPCAKEFDEFSKKTEIKNTNKQKYWISLDAITSTQETIHLFVNGCISDEKIDKFGEYAIGAKAAFLDPKYTRLLMDLGIEIIDVIVSVREKIDVTFIINKLIKNIPLSYEDIDEIYNILANMDIELDVNIINIDKGIISNPIHKGIILGLMLNSKNDLLDVFGGGIHRRFPEEYKKLLKISKEWSDDLLLVLEETNDSSFKVGATGAGPVAAAAAAVFDTGAAASDRSLDAMWEKNRAENDAFWEKLRADNEALWKKHFPQVKPASPDEDFGKKKRNSKKFKNAHVHRKRQNSKKKYKKF